MYLKLREYIRFYNSHGHASQCRIDIHVSADDTQTFIIAVHDRESYGTTITNAAPLVHWLGILLCRDRCLSMQDVLHIECFEHSALSPDNPTYDLVLFDEELHQEVIQSEMNFVEFHKQPDSALIPKNVPRSPLPQPGWVYLGQSLKPEVLQQAANRWRDTIRSQILSTSPPNSNANSGQGPNPMYDLQLAE